MPVFSFRAECMDDVEKLHEECVAAGIIWSMNAKPDMPYPDVDVEIKAETTLEVLRGLMRQVVDGHVMLQTLRECSLAENSLERDYELR